MKSRDVDVRQKDRFFVRRFECSCMEWKQDYGILNEGKNFIISLICESMDKVKPSR